MSVVELQEQQQDECGHVCGVPLTGPGYPGPDEGGWDTCREAAWQQLVDKVDGDIWSAEYIAEGGQRDFQSWRAEPCCTCSDRHTSNAEAVRPYGETQNDRSRKCLDALARWGRGE